MPEITKTYQLDMLNPISVSVLVRTYICLEEGAEPEIIGLPVRTSYANSEIGRQEVLDELPEDFSTAIFAVWGDEPTVSGPPAPEITQEEAR